jgi:ion channel
MTFVMTAPGPVRERMRESLTRQKLTCLLVTLLLLFLGTACQTAPGLGWLKLVLPFTLLAVLYTVTSRRRWQTGTVLAAPALAASWLNVLADLQFQPLMLVESGFAICFLAYTVWVILTHVLAETAVTLDTINGSLCVYLLLGIIWALSYGVIEHIAPGSFVETVKAAPGSRGDLAARHMFPLAYYSFMTITSVGYGDIVPVATAARALTVLEALAGQIYLAVLVARLMGIHIAQQMARPHSS